MPLEYRPLEPFSKYVLGTTTDLANKVLQVGELGYNTDYSTTVLGDGITVAGQLPTLNSSSPRRPKPRPGEYYNAPFAGGSYPTDGLTNNQIKIYPITFDLNMRVIEAATRVSTVGAAGSLYDFAAWRANEYGWPTGAPIFEFLDEDGTVANIHAQAVDFKVSAGEMIWCGVRRNTAANLLLTGWNGTTISAIGVNTLATTPLNCALINGTLQGDPMPTFTDNSAYLAATGSQTNMAAIFFKVA